MIPANTCCHTASFSLDDGSNKISVLVSYMAIVFTSGASTVLAIAQISKHAPGWFLPCWFAFELGVMNMELAVAGRFFPANMHGDRGALHTIKAVLWNMATNYLGILFCPAIQMRHRFMLGGARFFAWCALWVPVSFVHQVDSSLPFAASL